jgi:hypothetical protein
LCVYKLNRVQWQYRTASVSNPIFCAADLNHYIFFCTDPFILER